MLELTGFLGLTRISFFLLTRIPQIPLYCFVGGKSHRWFCVWAGSHGFHFAFGLTRISLFGLTRISQIPQYCCVGGKSHRCFCGWVARADSTWFLGSHGSHRSHSIALWVWAPGGCTGLALTDLFFGPFGQIRPIGQIGRIGHF